MMQSKVIAANGLVLLLLIKALCSGKSEDVTSSIDNGFVEAKEVEAISKLLGKPYKMKPQSQVGENYHNSRVQLENMGLYPIDADNIAQYYSKKPSSPCGVLAKQALEGNQEAFSKLQESPDYCNWEY
jgi:hypothetical protein